MNTERAMTLRGYNEMRRERLVPFDFKPKKKVVEQKKDFSELVREANKLWEDPCTGNLEVSLFWEEKFLALFRVLQLYSFYFLVFFEYWPSATREWGTGFFAGAIGAFHIWDQPQYIHLIQEEEYVKLCCWAFLGVSILVAFFWLVVLKSTWIRFRLDTVHTRVNWRRWWYLATELLYFPLIFNMAWLGNCHFMSKRDAISLATCANTDEAMYWILKAVVAWALAWGLFYNGTLLQIIEYSKISSTFHEQSVQKKEAEYVLGINRIWKAQKYYTFSSFRSGIQCMYHRVVLNMFCWLLVLTEVLMSEYSDQQNKVVLMSVLSVVFSIHCYVARPYRSVWTNAVYLTAVAGSAMQAVFINAVVSEYEQPIFVDRYFFILTLVLNGMIWFLIALVTVVMLVGKVKWVVVRRSVENMTSGQDLAIYYIKQARGFQAAIQQKKKLTTKDALKLQAYIEDLTTQFNNFRGSQPLVMDSLLETIDSLRLMQKK